MRRKLIKKVKKRKGFTLIELLAVILILGIIALIAIPTVSDVVKEAKKGSAKSSGNQIVKSLEQYYAACTLNYGVDNNGNNCYSNMKGSSYSSEDLASAIGVKGDFPERKDIIVMMKDDNNSIALVYKKGDFVCSNQVDEDGNLSYKYTGIERTGGVECTEEKVSSGGNILLETNGKKNVMKAYYENRLPLYEDFKSSEMKDKVYEIYFINNVDIPSTVDEDKIWDVSQDGDKSIMAWAVPLESNSDMYTVYIGSKGDIYCNPNGIYLFALMTNLTTIHFDNFHTDDVTSMSAMFYYDVKLEELDLSNFNTSNVTFMDALFYYCSNLKSVNLSSFETSNVTNMSYMFCFTLALTKLDLTNFNTKNVTTMAYMFSGFNWDNKSKLSEIKGLEEFNTSSLQNITWLLDFNEALESLDLTKWNTQSLTTARSAFANMVNLKYLNIKGWDTSNLVNTGVLLANTLKLKTLIIDNDFVKENCQIIDSFLTGSISLESIDVSKWNTKNIEDFSNVFNSMAALKSIDVSNWNVENGTNFTNFLAGNAMETIDLSGWNTANMENTTQMFKNDKNLKKIYVGSGWSTAKVTSGSGMFTGDTKLSGEKAYDSSQTNYKMATTSGYLTLK